jgi:hypothetical protein
MDFDPPEVAAIFSIAAIAVLMARTVSCNLEFGYEHRCTPHELKETRFAFG